MEEREASVADVVNSIRRLTRGLRVAAGNTQSQSGISAAQLFVLRYLANREPHSIKELAELTMTDRSSVAAVVDRLVARGFAERARAIDDRRRAEVRITMTGLNLLEAAPQAPTAMLMRGLEQLPDQRLRELSTALRELVEVMGLGAGPATMLFEDDNDSEAKAVT